MKDSVLGQITPVTLAGDKYLFSRAHWVADGSKAAMFVSGRCLYGIACLREEPTQEERFAEDTKPS